jgi:RND family efflux transporter MFP subunit
MTRKRLAILALAGALATGGGGVAYTNNQQAQKKVSAIETAVVARTTFTKSVTSSGKTKAAKSVELKFQSSGKLTWVGVKVGDTVTAHQAIAALDSREVQKNLENELRNYVAKRNDFEEMWRVTYKGIKDPQTALTDTVKRILEKNQWDLEKAVLDVEVKALSIEFATLTTPIAGIVTRVDTPVAGINITPATAVFEVVDPGAIVFEANVDETDVGNIAKGSRATIDLDAYPATPFEGSVSTIAFTAKTGSGGATVFPVEVAIATSSSVRVGMNGDVTIEAEKQEGVLVVPSEAIREDENGSYVYRKDGKMFQKISVVPGIQSGAVAVIRSGVREGDEVAVKGFKDLAK